MQPDGSCTSLASADGIALKKPLEEETSNGILCPSALIPYEVKFLHEHYIKGKFLKENNPKFNPKIFSFL